MKKLATAIIFMLILACLCACNSGKNVYAPTTPEATPAEIVQIAADEAPVVTPVSSRVFKFPQGTVICGVDVSGMIRPDAYRAICEGLDSYRFTLTVNNKSFFFSGADISLACPETTIIEAVSAMEAGKDITDIAFLTYDASAVRQRLASALNTDARNAAIRYDTATDAFQVTREAYGVRVDLDAIMADVAPAILSLNSTLNLNTEQVSVAPAIKADSRQVTEALAAANAYLDVELTYSYTPDGKPTQYESISRQTIASFISFDKDLSPVIDPTPLRNYVGEMDSKYAVKGESGQFKTTNGTYVDIDVDYAGQSLNIDGLYNDIYTCLSTRTSGQRIAPYLTVLECEDLAFGGNYVEIDLSSQFLWVYNDGVCVVATPIVSGCVNCRNYTPTGVYDIYYKTRNTYLVGTGYRSWVNYWMPFYRGYGLHDANWRSQFGEDIYLHDGSHGCVNIPPANAGFVYENVYVGTPVILYGGARSGDPAQQIINGTTSYSVPTGSLPFMLDAKPKYSVSKGITYVSSDPSVASVDPDGTVTVNGMGTTYITMTVPAQKYSTGAKIIITITVYDGCKVHGHSYGEWIIDENATCTKPGRNIANCLVCGHETEEVVAPLGHSFGDWITTAPSTCTVPGEQIHTCSVCGESEAEDLPLAEHTVEEWNIIEPTCQTPGSKSGICGVCSQTITEELPTTNHRYTDGAQFCDFGCGTVNPDFIPPADDEDDLPPDDNDDPETDGGDDPDPDETE